MARRIVAEGRSEDNEPNRFRRSLHFEKRSAEHDPCLSKLDESFAFAGRQIA
jgi:hypothetical protein